MSRPYTCCAQGRPGWNQLSAPARGQAASRDGSRRRLRQPGAVDAVLATLSNRVCKSVRHTFGVPLAASARRAGASPRLLIVSRHPMTATVLPKALSDSGSRQIDCAVHLYHCALRGGMMLLTRQAAAMTSFFCVCPDACLLPPGALRLHRQALLSEGASTGGCIAAVPRRHAPDYTSKS